MIVPYFLNRIADKFMGVGSNLRLINKKKSLYRYGCGIQSTINKIKFVPLKLQQHSILALKHNFILAEFGSNNSVHTLNSNDASSRKM
jgi:hypothetical protein